MDSGDSATVVEVYALVDGYVLMLATMYARRLRGHAADRAGGPFAMPAGCRTSVGSYRDCGLRCGVR